MWMPRAKFQWKRENSSIYLLRRWFILRLLFGLDFHSLQLRVFLSLYSNHISFVLFSPTHSLSLSLFLPRIICSFQNFSNRQKSFELKWMNDWFPLNWTNHNRIQVKSSHTDELVVFNQLCHDTQTKQTNSHTIFYVCCNSRSNRHLTTQQRVLCMDMQAWDRKKKAKKIKSLSPKRKIFDFFRLLYFETKYAQRRKKKKNEAENKIKMFKVAIKIKRLPFRTQRSTFAYLMMIPLSQ